MYLGRKDLHNPCVFPQMMVEVLTGYVWLASCTIHGAQGDSMRLSVSVTSEHAGYRASDLVPLQVCAAVQAFGEDPCRVVPYMGPTTYSSHSVLSGVFGCCRPREESVNI